MCSLSLGLYFSKRKLDELISFLALKHKYPAGRTLRHSNKHMVRFLSHHPENTQIIFTFTTPQTIETKQRQGDKRKTKGELINTNEPFCVCVDAHPRFF